jgi:hypothetical protein
VDISRFKQCRRGFRHQTYDIFIGFVMYRGKPSDVFLILFLLLGDVWVRIIAFTRAGAV